MLYPVVELNNSTIDALASRQDVTSALPHLFETLGHAKQAVARACGTCGGKAKAQSELGIQYDRIRSAVLASSAEHKNALKQFLNADTIRLNVGTDRSGFPIRHTIS